MDRISEADIAKARIDPRAKQILLTRALEELLGLLHRMQHDPAHSGPQSRRQLRRGAIMAVEVAGPIRAPREQTRPSPSACARGSPPACPQRKNPHKPPLPPVP